MNRYLFYVPARLGDALMLSPALRLLKSIQPLATVDILAMSSLSASIYRNNPHCQRIYVAGDLTQLDRARYHLLIVAHRGNSGVDFFDRLRMPFLLIEPADQQQAQAQQAIDFIASFFAPPPAGMLAGGYELYPDTADQEYVSRILSAPGRYLGLHLGCHGINKERGLFAWRKKKQHQKVWPLQRFVELARMFKQQYPDYRIVLTGGGNEEHLAQEFVRQVPDAINLAGKTDVLQLAAVMQRLSAYVSADTGAMHVACAMHVPLVALFGPTNLRRTGPYPQADFRRVIQSEDLSSLPARAVLQQLAELLEPDARRQNTPVVDSVAIG